MAIMRKKEVRELSENDLRKRLAELRLSLAKERGQIAIGGSPSNTGRVGEMKRTVARILTELNKRKQGGSKTGNM